MIALFSELPWRYQGINTYDYESVANTADPPDEKALMSLAVDQGLGDHPVYVIITRSQEAAGEAIDSLPVGWAYTLGQNLVNQQLATVLYTNKDAAVLQLVPPPGTTVPRSPPNQAPAAPGPAVS